MIIKGISERIIKLDQFIWLNFQNKFIIYYKFYFQNFLRKNF